MKNLILVFIVSIGCFQFLTAQVIWTNPITGTNPSADNPFTTGDVVTNVIVYGIGRGADIVAENSQNRYNANQWNTTTLNNGSYFSFKLKPNSGEYIHFSNLVFTYQRSNTGPTSFAFRASDDSYTDDIATGSILGNTTVETKTITLPFARFGNIGSEIEFRLYAWNASSKVGTYSVNSFTFNGIADNNILPVSFGDISGSMANNQLQMHWQTVCETNNDHFEIQVSKDGNEFVTIGKVATKALDGCSGLPISYSFSGSRPVLQGLFSLLLVGGLFAGLGRKRKWQGLSLALAFVFLAIACNKSTDIIGSSNPKIYARILQVDKDGAKRPSKVIIIEGVP